MKNIEKHILSNQYIVYKTKYLENYSKENFIKRIKQNKNIIDKKIEKKVKVIFKEYNKLYCNGINPTLFVSLYY